LICGASGRKPRWETHSYWNIIMVVSHVIGHRSPRLLRQCETLYMDGTFRSCPAPFEQLFTIMGHYHGRPVPLVNCLMEARTIGHYRHVLQLVKRHVRRVTGHRWRPATVIYNFELGLITAIETELPKAHVSGCFFHFTKSLWRRIQALKLSGPYRNDRHLEKCVQKVMALSYLPLILVRNNFRQYTRSRAVRRLMNRYPTLREWLDYVRGTYIDGPFELVLWSLYQRNMDTQTNKNIESEYTVLPLVVMVGS